jgi:hypothetical protein
LYGFGKTKVAAKQALDRKLVEKKRTRSAEGLTPQTKLLAAGEQWLERIQRPDVRLNARSVDDYSRTWRYVAGPSSPLRGLTLAEATT